MLGGGRGGARSAYFASDIPNTVQASDPGPRCQVFKPTALFTFPLPRCRKFCFRGGGWGVGRLSFGIATLAFGVWVLLSIILQLLFSQIIRQRLESVVMLRWWAQQSSQGVRE
jgi:hypothetical protein